jgi:hypothetical protein
VRDVTSTTQRPKWIKFEYFNFPIARANDFHSQLQAHFEYLKDRYIRANHIMENNILNMTHLLGEDASEFLNTELAAAIQKQVKGIDFAHSPAEEHFNEEELLLMNRLASYLFRLKGEKVTYFNFVAKLTAL